MPNRDWTWPKWQWPLTGQRKWGCNNNGQSWENIPFEKGCGQKGCGQRKWEGWKWTKICD